MQDYAEMLYWYRLAAEQGDATAQNNLGMIYQGGRGVAHDFVQATEWYRLAAEQDEIIAKNNLLAMYDGYLVPVLEKHILDYRIDVDKYKISKAQRLLKQLTNKGNFEANYHLAIVNDSEEWMKQFPNEFLDQLKNDSCLDEIRRFKWEERLFIEVNREKNFFESRSEYADRPKLSDENLLYVGIAIVKRCYANLSQITKGYHAIDEIVDFLSIPKAKERIEKILEVIDIIPVGHEDYAEAQFIAAHLNYLKNREGDEWKMHFNLCINSDSSNKWVNVCEEKSDYQRMIDILKIYTQLNKVSGAQDQIEALRENALKQVGYNSKSLSPLFRLSLLTEEREKRKHYLISLKGIDENFIQTRKWIQCLKADKAIEEKKEAEILEDMSKLEFSQ